MPDYQCPKCHATDENASFSISGTATFVMDSGGIQDYHAVEWTDESYISCNDCGHDGTIATFTFIPTER